MRQFALTALITILFSCLCLAQPVPSPGVSITYAYIKVNITNEPPLITSLALGPVPLYEDSGIECNPSSYDRENEPVQYRYAWYRNNERIDFVGRELPPGYIKANDHVSCEATPYDAHHEGSSALTSGIVAEMPAASKTIKTALSAVGVETNAREISAATQKGLAATTGFVVSEVGSSSTAQTGLLFFAFFLLVAINVNLLIRIRRRRLSAEKNAGNT